LEGGQARRAAKERLCELAQRHQDARDYNRIVQIANEVLQLFAAGSGEIVH
jgi:hypothetical protein